MLAPPWIPVPAPGYGGIEEVVRLLCDGFVGGGHEVTLFAPPRSRSCAEVQPLLEEPHPDQIERSRWEVDHVARAFDAIDAAAGSPGAFDVVHDHCGFAALAMADRLATPLVHTMHGPLDDETSAFYATHAHKGEIVAISHAQLEGAPSPLRDATVVHNPLEFGEWALSTEPGDHVLWMGRMAPFKGPHRAIAAARSANVPIVLAGPVQPGQEAFLAAEVEPHLDGKHVRYVGEVQNGGKDETYGAARALLMPIRWAEPFGMVMTEAMACGTPVIAFPEGSAPEVITQGVTGFLVEDEAAMAAAIGRIDEIDRAACRAQAERQFGVEQAVSGYLQVYERAVAARRRAERLRTHRPGVGRSGAPPGVRAAAARATS